MFKLRHHEIVFLETHDLCGIIKKNDSYEKNRFNCNN